MSEVCTRREFIHTAAMATAATAAAARAHAAESRRNIVFFLIDDMRWDSMSCMGHPFLETPHLDALVKNGLLFENAFVTTSLCSPSRASILTGQYAHKHGIVDNGTAFPENTWTFPRTLQQSGYRTGFAGKWHMGGVGDEPQPGFDFWASFKGQGVYENPTFNVNGERKQVEGYVTDLITDYSVDFLKNRGDRPFFLYISHKAVHANFTPAPRYKGCYADKTFPHPASMADTEENYKGKPEWVRKQRSSWHGVDGMYDKKVDFDDFARDYAETMRAVDDSVGRVVETLRAEGILDSTLIVFTSDNGFLFGEHGLIDKRCMYEPSIRIPLIAHCPDLIKPGTRRSELATILDFAPTFLEAAGASAPDSIQGQSLMPIIRGEQPEWRDAFLYEYFWERPFIQTPTVFGIRTGRYKLMKFHGINDIFELYDLESDPGEMHNLIADYTVDSSSNTIEGRIRANAPEDLKQIFNGLNDRLAQLMKEAGVTDNPTWLP